MKNKQIIQKLVFLTGTIGIAGNVSAAAFQLWGQDAGSIGNYHAGRAAVAADASTNYYNPAGLVEIQNQQLLFGVTPTATDVRFQGTVAVNTLAIGRQPVTAQGGTFNFLPNAHYAAPLADNLVFGISVITPFSSKTNYGLTSNAQYAATQSSIRVYDVAPSLGFAYNEKISVGFGLDVQYARGEFDYTIGSGSASTSTLTKSTGGSYGYGYHLGALYKTSEQTRIGLSFISQVKHHLHGGSSNFTGPLANNGVGGIQTTTGLKANITLPSTTTLSIFHNINPTWDVMGTVLYTQWSAFKQLMLQNTSGISNGVSNTHIIVIMPQNYGNTWNYAIGANYHVNENLFFRTGVGYDQAPSNNQYRNLQFPASNQVAIALGAHFQTTKTLGLDLGWTHLFAANTRINNLSQALGDQVTTTNGSINTSADVYGLEVKWDIV